MSSSHDAAISHKGDMSFKLKAIEYTQRVSNNAAVKKYKVDVKPIREWRKKKQSIAELKEKHKGQGRKNLEGGERRAVDSDLDDIILEWIYGRRANGLRVYRKLIMVKAKHPYGERYPEGEQDMFKGTEGWLQKFRLYCAARPSSPDRQIAILYPSGSETFSTTRVSAFLYRS